MFQITRPAKILGQFGLFPFLVAHPVTNAVIFGPHCSSIEYRVLPDFLLRIAESCYRNNDGRNAAEAGGKPTTSTGNSARLAFLYHPK
jgi:hypothetical protein